MQDPYIGELCLYPYNYAPLGWAPCNGQVMSIAQYSALFSLLGTTYGGDGVRTFNLPDLRSRTPVGQGQGPGLSQIDMGEMDGEVNVTLSFNQLPMHGHALAGTATADSTTPVGKTIATAADPNSGNPLTAYAAADGSTMFPGMVQPEGGNQSFNNRPPYLGLEWCIALTGVYPTRQ